jgi:hypothetical protein
MTNREQGHRLTTLQSAAIVFTLDTSDGLRAVSWQNRLTGRTLSLGNGPEVEFDLGLPGQPLKTPRLRVVNTQAPSEDPGHELVIALAGDEPGVEVTVTYRWDDHEPVLRKVVTITNRGPAEWNRLLNVRLGTYRADAELSGGELEVYPPSFRDTALMKGGLQGFPVYAAGEFFFGLAHPAGCATRNAGEVSLRHYPGARLPPGESFTCMEAVYGVGAAGRGREAFVAHVRGRMRRVRRGHDRPYAILEPFGARREEDVGASPKDALFNETEAFVLEMIGKVAEGQRDSDCRFDFFSVDFWVDNKGDTKQADPVRFPNQFETIKAALSREGLKLGLWIDSTGCGWSIGGNPATHGAIAQTVGQEFVDLGVGEQQVCWFCRATEPIRSLFKEGFCHHIRENGVRLLKFDNFRSQCSNPRHEHLPGVYANEATHEALVEFYQALDAECPDVFIMLYWGYRSPWWLLFGDTMFETGVQMEAASPGHLPAPFIRDGITRKLDQGHMYAKDVPWLGTDSLGVWLSHWKKWNSGVGTERWQEGFVMDICRGHALAQPWSDPQWLNPVERRQMGEFIAIMKARPSCFINSRLILGDPRKMEPYGYICADGQRAFLAINNATWNDRLLTLQLHDAWGLPRRAEGWDLYRWYPSPARLTGKGKAHGTEVGIALRPFEVVLLEAVPHGELPTLEREFLTLAIPVGFDEPSRPVELSVSQEAPTGALPVPFAFKGNVALPAACLVFAPFVPQDGVPSPELLQRVPDILELGGRQAKAQPASFGSDRILDLAPLMGETGPLRLKKSAFVYIPFAAGESGPATFGFGADFWYEAYLDGTLISETLSQSDGNQSWPPSIHDHPVTVELKQGEHLLVVRLLRGAATAQLAVGGPLDLLNVSWRRLRGDMPASPNGGLLVIVAELLKDEQPLEIENLGLHLTAVLMTVEGIHATLCPVLSRTVVYPSSWQSWRYAIAPGSSRRAFDVWVARSARIGDAQLRFTAHVLPQ